jgi:glycosyltransferase involved in cell wall biosynthesis
MRILVLIHEYPPVGGGGGQVAEDICGGLVKRGHEVRVITAHLKGLPLEEIRSGVQIIRLRSGRKFAYKATFSAMSLFIFAGFWYALSEIRSWKPDIIHVHFAVPAGVLGWWLSIFTKVPYILTAHLGDVPGGVPEKTDKWFSWVAPFIPPIWNRAKRVVAVSIFTKNLALQRYPVPIEVIPNGVSTNEFDPRLISLHEPPNIIFAGRIVPQKNPIQVIRSLAIIKDLVWHAVIIGDGSMKPEMESESVRLGINDRITFTGWLTPDQVHEWYKKGDILFMPSLSEGLPVVGVQALSMGLAFVAGKVGGFIDLVEEGKNGYLHSPSDRDMFSQSLRILLEDRRLLYKFRLQSREISKKFDLERIVDAYEKILLESKR